MALLLIYLYSGCMEALYNLSIFTTACIPVTSPQVFFLSWKNRSRLLLAIHLGIKAKMKLLQIDLLQSWQGGDFCSYSSLPDWCDSVHRSRRHHKQVHVWDMCIESEFEADCDRDIRIRSEAG